VKNRVLSKDYPLNGRVYRITKADPRSACWLFTLLAGRSDGNNNLLSSLGRLSHSEFDEVQAMALSKVSLVDSSTENVFVTPIISVDGKWADKTLSENADEVLELTTQSIMLTVSPFLSGQE